MLGKMCLDQGEHLTGRVIVTMVGQVGDIKIAIDGLSIVVIEVPLSTGRLPVLHQQPCVSAHSAGSTNRD